MTIKELHGKILSIEKEYDKKVSPIIDSLEKKYEKFKGLDVIIPKGVYKGRVGKITYVSLDRGCVRGVIQPYKKTTKGELTNELLWDRVDARTFWDLSEIKSIFIEGAIC